MSKKTTIALGLLCVGLAVSTFVYWREWKAQRDETNAAIATRDETESRNRELTAQIEELRNGRRRGSPYPPGSPRDDSGALGGGSANVGANPDPPERPTSYPEGVGAGRPGMPGMRGNRNLIANLKLNETEAEKLNRLLNQRQAQARQIGQQNGGRADRKVMDEFRKETDRQVQTLLGDSKYGEYEDYFRNVEEHMRVSQLERRLQDTGAAALSASQQTQLFDLLREEKALIPAPLREAYATPQQYRAAANAWQSDYEQRVTARASSLLSSDQLSAFSTPPRNRRRD